MGQAHYLYHAAVNTQAIALSVADSCLVQELDILTVDSTFCGLLQVPKVHPISWQKYSYRSNNWMHILTNFPLILYTFEYSLTQ